VSANDSNFGVFDTYVTRARHGWLRNSATLMAVVVILELAIPAPAARAADGLAPLSSVLGELRKGGLVIYFRHGATDQTGPGDEAAWGVVAPVDGRLEPVAVAAADDALDDVVAVHLGEAGGVLQPPQAADIAEFWSVMLRWCAFNLRRVLGERRRDDGDAEIAAYHGRRVVRGFEQWRALPEVWAAALE